MSRRPTPMRFPAIASLAALCVAGSSFAFELDFTAAESNANQHGRFALESTTAEISEDDLKRFVSRLASTEYEGRGTGDRGERMATSFLASFFEGLGLAPAGDEGSFFQSFPFDSGKTLKGANLLEVRLDEPLGLVRQIEPGADYQPLNFSPSGTVDTTAVVFAGFGIGAEDYDSFEGLDLSGRWVVMLRGAPEGNEGLQRFAPLVSKAQQAKERGAAGAIFVRGPNPNVSSELVPPSTNIGARGEILPAITISDRFAAVLLTGQQDPEPFEGLYRGYFSGERVAGFPLPFRVSAQIGLKGSEGRGRNVIARLAAGDEPSPEAIVIGAHIDHIGYGNRGGSRAQGSERDLLHLGADDNASGVSALMELAQHYASLKRDGQLTLKRDLVFAAWSGEEIGLYGSRHFVGQVKGGDEGEIYPAIAAYINLDMVGRLGDQPLNVQGTGSSSAWPELLDSVASELPTKRSPSPYLPTDSSPFYAAGVPVLALFTGLHDDYHTPADTIDKIDFDGLGEVTRYLQALTATVSNAKTAPPYVEVPRQRRPNAPKVAIGIRTEDAPDGAGVRVVEVMPGSPALRAGIEAGDVLVKLDGKEVANFQSLRQILRKLEADTEYPTRVTRDDMQIQLKIVPEKR